MKRWLALALMALLLLGGAVAEDGMQAGGTGLEVLSPAQTGFSLLLPQGGDVAEADTALGYTPSWTYAWADLAGERWLRGLAFTEDRPLTPEDVKAVWSVDADAIGYGDWAEVSGIQVLPFIEPDAGIQGAFFWTEQAVLAIWSNGAGDGEWTRLMARVLGSVTAGDTVTAEAPAQREPFYRQLWQQTFQQVEEGTTETRSAANGRIPDLRYRWRYEPAEIGLNVAVWYTRDDEEIELTALQLYPLMEAAFAGGDYDAQSGVWTFPFTDEGMNTAGTVYLLDGRLVAVWGAPADAQTLPAVLQIISGFVAALEA